MPLKLLLYTQNFEFNNCDYLGKLHPVIGSNLKLFIEKLNII